MPIAVIFAVIIALSFFYFWIAYNGLITAKLRISEALAQIDVQLKRRTDLIPNIVESVKGYAAHEKQVFEDVTKARASLMSASSTAQKAGANDMLTNSLKSLFAVAENYPDLKASQNFLELQEELSDTENKIAYSRQFLNTNVLDYNTKLQIFPSNIIANTFHFQPADFFAASEDDKQPVKVDFSKEEPAA